MKRTKDQPKRWKLFILAALPVATMAIIGSFITSPQAAHAPADSMISNGAAESTSVVNIFVQRTFGYSEKGRSIDGYEIGSGNECLLFFGGTHGDEKGTVELLETLANEIFTNPSLVGSTKKLILIPLLNPDGYYDAIYRANTNGVNINRNFPTTEWMPYPDQDTFAGAAPFSENESQVIRDVVEECKPSLMLAFHSQGGVVSPEAGEESMAVAEWYIEKTGYQYFNDWDYPGTATKWFTETTGNPSLTIELTSDSESDWEINKAAILQILNTTAAFGILDVSQ